MRRVKFEIEEVLVCPICQEQVKQCDKCCDDLCCEMGCEFDGVCKGNLEHLCIPCYEEVSE